MSDVNSLVGLSSYAGLPMSRIQTWKKWQEMLDLAEKQGGDDLVIETERWLGRNDLFYLLVRLLRRNDINNDFMFDRCREVESAPNGYLDLWAREHGKSSIITFGLTIQDVLRDPEITCGIFSHTRPIAKTFLSNIKREFEGNEYLKALYSDVLFASPHKEAAKWSEDEGIIVRRQSNPKEATVEAWGLVDGQPTGRHFKLRIYDDVVTRESVTTPEQITKTTLAWELSDNLGTVDGYARHIGTRYALYDTYQSMLERGAVIPRIYPATHNGQLNGRPVYFSQETWARKLRTQSRPMVAAQLLQNPMADSAATFNVAWLKSYAIRPRTLNVYIMCDPSRGRSATSDNTAISVIGIASNGAKFLLDGVCHRMPLSQRWYHLSRLYRKWSKVTGIAHIAAGYERYGAQSDDEYFREKMLEDQRKGIDNAIFPIKELNWTKDGAESKKERVERLEPDFRNGRFFLPYPVLVNDNQHGYVPRTWRVDVDTDGGAQICYTPIRGRTKEQIAAIEGGSADLIAKCIKCVDEDNHVYDLTLKFIDEYSTFPFGQFKDLVDASSRIYDMESSPPLDASRMVREPMQHFDR